MWNIAIIIFKKKEQMEIEKTTMRMALHGRLLLVCVISYRRYSRSSKYNSKTAATVARSSGVRELK